LLQLKALAENLEDETKVRRLASIAEQAETEVRKWLAVLARCSELQAQLDVLDIDVSFAETPNELDRHRIGLQNAWESRLREIDEYTEVLLDRIETACATARAKAFWNLTNARSVVQSGNHVATEVHDFNEAIGIASDPRSFDLPQLDSPVELGAKAIQTGKDAAPVVAGVAAGIIAFVQVKNKIQGDDD
jgi:hypothetical protein